MFEISGRGGGLRIKTGQGLNRHLLQTTFKCRSQNKTVISSKNCLVNIVQYPTNVYELFMIRIYLSLLKLQYFFKNTILKYLVLHQMVKCTRYKAKVGKLMKKLNVANWVNKIKLPPIKSYKLKNKNTIQ